MFNQVFNSGLVAIGLGILSLSALADGIPPPPSDKQLLNCIAGPSYNEKKCDTARADLESHMTALSDACKDADTLEGKRIYLNDLLHLYANYNQFIQDERALNYEEMCGAFLWEQNTWVQAYTDDIVPPDRDLLVLDLEVGEEAEVKARIFTRICKTADDSTCGPWFELSYSGPWGWGSTDNEVFKVKEEISHTGQIKAVGNGTATLVVLVPGFEIDPHLLQAEPDVRVGGQNVDVAFVVYNGQYDYSRFPPYGWYLWTQFSDGWLDEFKKYFRLEQFDLSLITYNRHPSRCPDIGWCGFNSAPCSEHTTLMPFDLDPTTRINEWHSTWSGIETVCDEDPYPVIGEREADKGSSFYSALIDTIRNSQWSPDAKIKAIFAFPYYPTCAFYIGGPYAYTCDAEVGTGLTLADVASAANEEGVNLFVFNTNTERLPECGNDGCVTGSSNYNLCYAVKIAPRDEFVYLANSTNGEYYPVYCGNYTIDGAVKQAIADLHSRFWTP